MKLSHSLVRKLKDENTYIRKLDIEKVILTLASFLSGGFLYLMSAIHDRSNSATNKGK